MAAYAFNTASGSTTSGTYSSTYKSSRGSAVSSELDLASQLSRIDLSSGLEDDEENLKKIERAKRLAKEFCHGDGDIGAVVDRWLSELGFGWVLDLSDDPSAGTSLLRAQPQRNNLTEKWIRALTEITESTRLGSIHCLLWVVREVGDEEQYYVPSPVQLVRFVEAAVVKMLPFVDAVIAAADLDATSETANVSTGAQAPSEKLQTLLCVSNALSSASTGMQYFCFKYCDNRVKLETQRRSDDEVLNLLSAKEQMLEEAVWNTMEKVRTSILNYGDDDDKWGIQTRQGSPDICKVTRSLVTYVEYLWGSYWRVDHIVRTAAELRNYVPEQDQTSYFTLAKKTGSLPTLAVEMVSSLQVKLDERSETFPDHSLRFLFLINNTHFIWQQLHPLSPMKFRMKALVAKIEEYIQKYLQVSWEPVLSCLYNHKPRWFRKNSALPKFNSEFQKTYTAQKLWKVPDPGLRTRLRKAIVEKVVSGFTKYLKDNNITRTGITPHEREKMLLELFEG